MDGGSGKYLESSDPELATVLDLRHAGWFLLFIWFIWFIWLNETNQMNQTN